MFVKVKGLTGLKNLSPWGCQVSKPGAKASGFFLLPILFRSIQSFFYGLTNL